MPRGKTKHESVAHLGKTMDAITNCMRSLNSCLASLSDEQRDALCEKALAMHQESRVAVAQTHCITESTAPSEVPFT